MLNYRIKEVGIRWHDDGDSRLRPGRRQLAQRPGHFEDRLQPFPVPEAGAFETPAPQEHAAQSDHGRFVIHDHFSNRESLASCKRMRELCSTEQAAVSKWPKTFPPLTPEQKRISDDFMKYWHEVLPKSSA